MKKENDTEQTGLAKGPVFSFLGGFFFVWVSFATSAATFVAGFCFLKRKYASYSGGRSSGLRARISSSLASLYGNSGFKATRFKSRPIPNRIK